LSLPLSVTVSVAVVNPVTCPLPSNRISWIYVLPLLLEDAGDAIGGCCVKYVFESTLPSAFKNCDDVPPLFINEVAVRLPPFDNYSRVTYEPPV